MAEAFDQLLEAMRDELAALDSGDVAQIEAATRSKVDALTAVRGAAQVPLDRLHEARALNTLAATRVNMLKASVDRRLAMLVAASGQPRGLCYGRNGRSLP